MRKRKRNQKGQEKEKRVGESSFPYREDFSFVYSFLYLQAQVLDLSPRPLVVSDPNQNIEKMERKRKEKEQKKGGRRGGKGGEEVEMEIRVLLHTVTIWRKRSVIKHDGKQKQRGQEYTSPTYYTHTQATILYLIRSFTYYYSCHMYCI